MHLVIKKNDLPHLKQLSYRIVEYLNLMLESEKAQIRESIRSAFKDKEISSAAELKETTKSLFDYIQNNSPEESMTEADLYKICISDIPNRIGSSMIQVSIAKALGYKDWGELQAKAKHGHENACSQFEELYSENRIIDFTRGFIDATGVLEGVVNPLELRSKISIFLDEIHTPTSFQFSSTKNCIVVGGSRLENSKILASRIQLAEQSGDQIIVITTDKSSKGIIDLNISANKIQRQDIVNLPTGGNIILSIPSHEIVDACIEILNRRLQPAVDIGTGENNDRIHTENIGAGEKIDRIHIVINEEAELFTSSDLSIIAAQSRGLGCSFSLGVINPPESSVSNLRQYLANSFDVICHPKAPLQLKEFLSITAKENEIVHKPGACSRFLRRIKGFFRN